MKRALAAVRSFDWYRYFCLVLLSASILLAGIIIGFAWGEQLLFPTIEYGVDV